MGFGGQIVVEDCAVGRVFGGRLLWRQRSAGESIVVNAYGCLRLVEDRRGAGCICDCLAQRRDVIENPEGAAMRGNDQIVAMHDQVAHR